MDIWNNTQKISKNYPFEKAEKITASDFELENTNQKSFIKVVHQDSLTCAELLVKKFGFETCILIFANNDKPGGCVDQGYGTQEEDIYRRSNAHLAFDKSLYPINSDVLFSSKISVFKSSIYTEKEYKLIKPFETAMIACSALVHPEIKYVSSHRQYSKESDRKIMSDKIHLICQTAIKYFSTLKYKRHALILGAWGCGSYGNPEYEIIQLFNEILPQYPLNYFIAVKGFDEKENDNNYLYFKKHIQINQNKSKK